MASRCTRSTFCGSAGRGARVPAHSSTPRGRIGPGTCIGRGRPWPVFSLLLGLAATNHVTIVLVLPGLLIVALRALGVRDLLRALDAAAASGSCWVLAHTWLLVAAQRDPASRGRHAYAFGLVPMSRETCTGLDLLQVRGRCAPSALLLIRVPWDLAGSDDRVRTRLGLMAQRTRRMAGMALAFRAGGAGVHVGLPRFRPRSLPPPMVLARRSRSPPGSLVST
jgi:hypothetical protein